MKRIGVAASKIAKDNYWLYYFYVILISLMLSLLLFLVVGMVVIFAIAVLTYVATELMGYDFAEKRNTIVTICMATLTVVILLFNVFSILCNINFSKESDKKVEN